MAERPNGRRPLGGPPHAPPRAGGSALPLAPGLAAELEGTLVEAAAGRAAHEALAPMLRREARAILLRHGLPAAEVQVTQVGGECHVHVRLPKAAPLVVRVRVDLD